MISQAEIKTDLGAKCKYVVQEHLCRGLCISILNPVGSASMQVCNKQLGQNCKRGQ